MKENIVDLPIKNVPFPGLNDSPPTAGPLIAMPLNAPDNPVPNNQEPAADKQAPVLKTDEPVAGSSASNTWHMIASTFAIAQPFIAMHIDTWFAERLGTSEVAALSVGITSILTWTWVITALSWPLGTYLGRAAADRTEVQRIFFFSLKVIVTMGLLIGVPLYFLTDHSLRFAGADPEQLLLGSAYHRIMAAGIFVIAVYQLTVRFLLTLNRYSDVFIVALITLILNLTGNFAALYLFRANLAGLAVSVIVSQAVGSLISLWLIYYKGSNAENKAAHAAADQDKFWRSLIYSMIASLSVTVVYYTLGALCNQLGINEAAAHIKIYSLFLGTVTITSGSVNTVETKGFSVSDLTTGSYRSYYHLALRTAFRNGIFFSFVYCAAAGALLIFSSYEVAGIMWPLAVISLLLVAPSTYLWTFTALLRSQNLFEKTLLVEFLSMASFVLMAWPAYYAGQVSTAWVIWLLFAIYFLIRLGLAYFVTRPKY